MSTTLSDKPQLLAINLVCTSAPRLLPSVEKHFVASKRQVLLLVGVADLKPGEIFGVAHALHSTRDRSFRRQKARPPSPHDPSTMSPAFSASVSPLPAATAPASPPLALLEHLISEQCASFLRVCPRLPSHLLAVVFDLQGSD